MVILATPLRAALFAVAIASAATIVAHLILTGASALGINATPPAIIEWLFWIICLPAWPGAILGWMMIWGDNATDSMGEHIVSFAISMAFNSMIAFGVGYIPLAAWQARHRFRFGLMSMLVGVTAIAVGVALVVFLLRYLEIYPNP